MATTKEIEYLKANFDFWGLRDIGFFDKDTKPTDYDSQIDRICIWFDIKSIFHYDIIMLQKNKYIKAEVKTFSEN